MLNTDIKKNLIKVLAYSHIFKHPLTLSEIQTRVDVPNLSEDQITSELALLIDRKIVFDLGGYYSLENNSILLERRIEEEKRGEKYLKIARYTSKIIYLVPFVRAVYISGSLSKGRVAKGGDIDFFMVTKTNRLWIARMLTIFIKKTILLNSFKYFCVNYFVDESNLEIRDKNRFTATEVITIIPIRGKAKLLKQFEEQNQWFDKFYPNFQFKRDYKHWRGNGDISKSILKVFEWPFIEPIAEKLEQHFMKMTYKRWYNRFNQTFNDRDFELSFRTSRGISKNHRGNNQKIIQDKLDNIYHTTLAKLETETEA